MQEGKVYIAFSFRGEIRVSVGLITVRFHRGDIKLQANVCFLIVLKDQNEC